MAEPVIVPITLEVTDIDMEHVDFGDAKKTIEKSLKDVKQSMQDVFSGISDESVNKAVKKSMNGVSNSVYKTTLAYKQFEYAMNRAAKSSAEYKRILDDVTRTEKELARANESLNEFTVLDDAGRRVGRAGVSDDFVNIQIDKIHELESNLANLKKELKPENFALSGSPELIAKLDEAYIRLIKNVTDLNESQKEFNQTAQDNSISDEYNELVKQADKYKAQLEKLNEKSKEMETLGATDKAWEKMQYDVAKTKDQLDGVLSSMRKLVKEGNAFRFGEGNKKELNNQISSYAMSDRNIEKYTTERAQRNESPYTADYQAQMNELDKLSAKLTAIEEKAKKLHDTNMGSPRQFVSLKYDAEQVEKKIQSIIQSMRQMVAVDKAFKFDSGNDSAELDKLDKKLKEISESMSNVTKNSDKKAKSFKGETSAVKKDASILGRFRNICSGVAGTISKLGSLVIRSTKNFRRFSKEGSKSTSGINKGFKHLLKNILTFGLGFRTLYYAIKRMRTVFVESFKVLASQFPDVDRQLVSLIKSFRQLRGSVLTAFQPIATVVIPILKSFMDYMTGAMESLGKFFAVLTGQKFIYKAIANDINSVADAAKNAEKKLASYDKLEVINKENNDPTNLGVTYTKADAEGAVSEFAQLVKEAWENADFTEVGVVVGRKMLNALTYAQATVLPGINKFLQRITSSIATFMNGFTDWEALALNIGTTVAHAVDIVADAFNNLFTTVDWEKLGGFIGTTISSLFMSVDWNSVATAFTNSVNSIITTLTSLYDSIDWARIGSKLGSAMYTMIRTFNFENVGYLLAGKANSLATLIVNAVGEIDWRDAGKSFADGVNMMITTWDPSLSATAISDVILGLLDMLVSFIEETDWNQLGDKLGEVIGNIDWSGIISLLFEGLASVLGGLSSFILGFIRDGWESVVDWWYENAMEDGEFVIEGLLEGLLNGIIGIGLWIYDNIFTPIINGFKKAFGIASPSKVMMGIGGYIVDGFILGLRNIVKKTVKIIEDLKLKVKVPINAVIGVFERLANGVIDGINNMIRALNKLKFDVPDWVPLIGGSKFGLNIKELSKVSIPRLANGAVIPPNKEFLALLGDQKRGTNIEAPLETIKQAVAEVLASMGGQQTIVLELDGKTVARVVWDESEKRYKQTGKAFAY